MGPWGSKPSVPTAIVLPSLDITLDGTLIINYINI
jgi:hypothetical protein